MPKLCGACDTYHSDSSECPPTERQLLKTIDEIERKYELCLDFVREQARYECYAMCSCQTDAKAVLDKIGETSSEPET